MIELLAPAGTKDALIAAVENGANTIYLAGNMFGARAYADNFDNEALREAIRFAHLRNVSIHVTVNTIVDDSEIPSLIKYLRFLYEAGTDAILVQDLGVAKLAHEVVPDMPLHASTQMTVHNLAGVKALTEMGFTRVVLSRELSIEEIKYICENSDVEIEVFAHGALCVCYSGQCLMSSMIGGRSGNRGKCAQPCRLPYTLIDEDEHDVLKGKAGQYLLSPRDLNTLELIPELMDAGVASLKIEGRMKKPEYVAVVVDVYRRAIDKAMREKGNYAISDEDNSSISQIFNRDFTTAYLKGYPGRDFMSDRRPNNRGLLVARVVKYRADKKRVFIKCSQEIHEGDEVEFWVKVGGRLTLTIHDMKNKSGKTVTTASVGETVSLPLEEMVHEHDRLFRVYDAHLMQRAQSTYKSGAPVLRVPIIVEAKAKLGEPFALKMTSADGYTAEASSEFIVEKAKNRPISEDTVKKQMNRLGTTVYEATEFKIVIDDNAIVPVSVLNDVRRKVTDALDKARLEKYKRPAIIVKESSSHVIEQADKQKKKKKTRRAKIMVAVDSLDMARTAIDAGADGILFGGDSYHHKVICLKEYEMALEMAHRNNRIIHFNTPRIVRYPYVEFMEKLLSSFNDMRPDGINVHNIGTLYMAREKTNIPIQSDFSLIAFNDIAIDELRALGVSRATLSPELNFGQIEKIAAKSSLPLECIVYGRIELMVSAYCAMGTFIGHDSGKEKCTAPCTKDSYALKDRMGAKFPLVTDGFCNMHVLNSKTLSMLPHAARFSSIGIDMIRIDARFMKEEELARIISAYRDFLNLGGAELTERQKKFAEKIEGTEITRGHYFRGVV